MLKHSLPRPSSFSVPRRHFWQFVSTPETQIPPLAVPFGAPKEGGKLLHEPLQLTQLPNGVRVASEDNGGFQAHITIVTGYGVRNEPINFKGLTSVRSKMLLQSTNFRFNPVRVVRDISETASLFTSDAGRESTSFSISGLRENIPSAFEILADLALHPRFNEWEVKDTLALLQDKEHAHQGDKDASIKFEDLVHGAAFNFVGLGNGQYIDGSRLENHEVPSHELLADWNKFLFSDPSRIVVSGVNVPHEILVELATHTFGTLDTLAKPTEYILPFKEPAKYIGGESRTLSSDSIQVALGFPTPGFKLGKKYIAYNLLHFLLGSGADFSAGGPGKGIHTRLSQDITHTNADVQLVGAEIRPYSDAGLFFIHAKVGRNGKLITNQIARQFAGLLDVGSKNFSSDEEIVRAKNRLKTHYYQTGEDEAANAGDLAAQVLINGNRPSAAELFTALDELTANDVKSAVEQMLSQKPTFVATGSIEGIAPYHVLESAFSRR